MTSFDDRKNAFENKFALDEAMLFKAEARCCKLFGLWMAEKIGLSSEEAKVYAAKIVGANLEEPGFDDVKRAVAADIQAHKLDLSDAALDAKLEELFVEAQKQVKEGQ